MKPIQSRCSAVPSDKWQDEEAPVLGLGHAVNRTARPACDGTQASLKPKWGFGHNRPVAATERRGDKENRTSVEALGGHAGRGSAQLKGTRSRTDTPNAQPRAGPGVNTQPLSSRGNLPVVRRSLEVAPKYAGRGSVLAAASTQGVLSHRAQVLQAAGSGTRGSVQPAARAPAGPINPPAQCVVGADPHVSKRRGSSTPPPFEQLLAPDTEGSSLAVAPGPSALSAPALPPRSQEQAGQDVMESQWTPLPPRIAIEALPGPSSGTASRRDSLDVWLCDLGLKQYLNTPTTQQVRVLWTRAHECDALRELLEEREAQMAAMGDTQGEGCCVLSQKLEGITSDGELPPQPGVPAAEVFDAEQQPECCPAVQHSPSASMAPPARSLQDDDAIPCAGRNTGVAVGATAPDAGTWLQCRLEPTSPASSCGSWSPLAGQVAGRVTTQSISNMEVPTEQGGRLQGHDGGVAARAAPPLPNAPDLTPQASVTRLADAARGAHSLASSGSVQARVHDDDVDSPLSEPEQQSREGEPLQWAGHAQVAPAQRLFYATARSGRADAAAADAAVAFDGDMPLDTQTMAALEPASSTAAPDGNALASAAFISDLHSPLRRPFSSTPEPLSVNPIRQLSLLASTSSNNSAVALLPTTPRHDISPIFAAPLAAGRDVSAVVLPSPADSGSAFSSPASSGNTAVTTAVAMSPVWVTNAAHDPEWVTNLAVCWEVDGEEGNIRDDADASPEHLRGDAVSAVHRRNSMVLSPLVLPVEAGEGAATISAGGGSSVPFALLLAEATAIFPSPPAPNPSRASADLQAEASLVADTASGPAASMLVDGGTLPTPRADSSAGAVALTPCLHASICADLPPGLGASSGPGPLTPAWPCDGMTPVLARPGVSPLLVGLQTTTPFDPTTLAAAGRSLFAACSKGNAALQQQQQQATSQRVNHPCTPEGHWAASLDMSPRLNASAAHDSGTAVHQSDVSSTGRSWGRSASRPRELSHSPLAVSFGRPAQSSPEEAASTATWCDAVSDGDEHGEWTSIPLDDEAQSAAPGQSACEAVVVDAEAWAVTSVGGGAESPRSLRAAASGGASSGRPAAVAARQDDWTALLSPSFDSRQEQLDVTIQEPSCKVAELPGGTPVHIGGAHMMCETLAMDMFTNSTSLDCSTADLVRQSPDGQLAMQLLDGSPHSACGHSSDGPTCWPLLSTDEVGVVAAVSVCNTAEHAHLQLLQELPAAEDQQSPDANIPAPGGSCDTHSSSPAILNHDLTTDCAVSLPPAVSAHMDMSSAAAEAAALGSAWGGEHCNWDDVVVTGLSSTHKEAAEVTVAAAQPCAAAICLQPAAGASQGCGELLLDAPPPAVDSPQAAEAAGTISLKTAETASPDNGADDMVAHHAGLGSVETLTARGPPISDVFNTQSEAEAAAQAEAALAGGAPAPAPGMVAALLSAPDLLMVARELAADVVDQAISVIAASVIATDVIPGDVIPGDVIPGDVIACDVLAAHAIAADVIAAEVAVAAVIAADVSATAAVEMVAASDPSVADTMKAAAVVMDEATDITAADASATTATEQNAVLDTSVADATTAALIFVDAASSAITVGASATMADIVDAVFDTSSADAATAATNAVDQETSTIAADASAVTSVNVGKAPDTSAAEVTAAAADMAGISAIVNVATVLDVAVAPDTSAADDMDAGTDLNDAAISFIAADAIATTSVEMNVPPDTSASDESISATAADVVAAAAKELDEPIDSSPISIIAAGVIAAEEEDEAANLNQAVDNTVADTIAIVIGHCSSSASTPASPDAPLYDLVPFEDTSVAVSTPTVAAVEVSSGAAAGAQVAGPPGACCLTDGSPPAHDAGSDGASHLSMPAHFTTDGSCSAGSPAQAGSLNSSPGSFHTPLAAVGAGLSHRNGATPVGEARSGGSSGSSTSCGAAYQTALALASWHRPNTPTSSCQRGGRGGAGLLATMTPRGLAQPFEGAMPQRPSAGLQDSAEVAGAADAASGTVGVAHSPINSPQLALLCPTDDVAATLFGAPDPSPSVSSSAGRSGSATPPKSTAPTLPLLPDPLPDAAVSMPAGAVPNTAATPPTPAATTPAAAVTVSPSAIVAAAAAAGLVESTNSWLLAHDTAGSPAEETTCVTAANLLTPVPHWMEGLEAVGGEAGPPPASSPSLASSSTSVCHSGAQECPVTSPSLLKYSWGDYLEELQARGISLSDTPGLVPPPSPAADPPASWESEGSHDHDSEAALADEAGQLLPVAQDLRPASGTGERVAEPNTNVPKATSDDVASKPQVLSAPTDDQRAPPAAVSAYLPPRSTTLLISSAAMARSLTTASSHQLYKVVATAPPCGTSYTSQNAAPRASAASHEPAEVPCSGAGRESDCASDSTVATDSPTADVPAAWECSLSTMVGSTPAAMAVGATSGDSGSTSSVLNELLFADGTGDLGLATSAPVHDVRDLAAEFFATADADVIADSDIPAGSDVSVVAHVATAAVAGQHRAVDLTARLTRAPVVDAPPAVADSGTPGAAAGTASGAQADTAAVASKHSAVDLSALLTRGLGRADIDSLISSLVIGRPPPETPRPQVPQDEQVPQDQQAPDGVAGAVNEAGALSGELPADIATAKLIELTAAREEATEADDNLLWSAVCPTAAVTPSAPNSPGMAEPAAPPAAELVLPAHPPVSPALSLLQAQTSPLSSPLQGVWATPFSAFRSPAAAPRPSTGLTAPHSARLPARVGVPLASPYARSPQRATRRSTVDGAALGCPPPSHTSPTCAHPAPQLSPHPRLQNGSNWSPASPLHSVAAVSSFWSPGGSPSNLSGRSHVTMQVRRRRITADTDLLLDYRGAPAALRAAHSNSTAPGHQLQASFLTADTFFGVPGVGVAATVDEGHQSDGFSPAFLTDCSALTEALLPVSLAVQAHLLEGHPPGILVDAVDSALLAAGRAAPADDIALLPALDNAVASCNPATSDVFAMVENANAAPPLALAMAAHDPGLPAGHGPAKGCQRAGSGEVAALQTNVPWTDDSVEDADVSTGAEVQAGQGHEDEQPCAASAAPPSGDEGGISAAESCEWGGLAACLAAADASVLQPAGLEVVVHRCSTPHASPLRPTPTAAMLPLMCSPSPRRGLPGDSCNASPPAVQSLYHGRTTPPAAHVQPRCLSYRQVQDGAVQTTPGLLQQQQSSCGGAVMKVGTADEGVQTLTPLPRPALLPLNASSPQHANQPRSGSFSFAQLTVGEGQENKWRGCDQPTPGPIIKAPPAVAPGPPPPDAVVLCMEGLELLCADSNEAQPVYGKVKRSVRRNMITGSQEKELKRRAQALGIRVSPYMRCRPLRLPPKQ